MTNDLKEILDFVHQIYQLKLLTRFKNRFWHKVERSRWDSVAEHTYRTALMALLLAPYLEKPVDLLKTLKIILIHDIVEIKTSDHDALLKDTSGGGHAFDKTAFLKKHRAEVQAAKEIFSALPKKFSREFYSLFNEYINTRANPQKSSLEGTFAYALDKIEAGIQAIDYKKETQDLDPEHHNLGITYIYTWATYDKNLKKFCQLLDQEASKLVRHPAHRLH